MKVIDIEQLRAHVNYDCETGVITYVKSGKVAANRDRDGYIRVSFKGSKYQAHRIAWALHHGEFPEQVIDHINHDKADNRIENLRLVTHAQNGANRARTRGIRQRADGKWEAQTKHHGKHIHIGRFECPLLARLAYIDKINELHWA